MYARDIARAAERAALDKIEVASSFGLSLTSYALDRGRAFPFVTLPGFVVRALKALELSKSEGMMWSPLVADADRAAWENYTVNEGPIWLRESLDDLGMTDAEVPGFRPFLHNLTGRPIAGPALKGDETLRDTYSPMWQGAPLTDIGTSINHDQLSLPLFRQVIQIAADHKKAAMTALFSMDEQLARSYIVVPVHSDFTAQASVVGTVGMLVPWLRYFEDVLPPDVKDVVVVLSDSCGTTYTLRVDGDHVEIAGKGDRHDTDYNDYKQSWTLGGVAGDTEANFYVEGRCAYTLDIYPSQELEDEYLSNQPVIYAIAVAVIFIFTAFIFLVYDWAVQLRQNKVLKTATRTQAIVSSLFPKNVQERIFKDVEQEVKNEAKQPAISRFRGNRTKDQLKTFLDDGIGGGKTKDEGPANLKSKPIADLFPEATIIFAE